MTAQLRRRAVDEQYVDCPDELAERSLALRPEDDAGMVGSLSV